MITITELYEQDGPEQAMQQIMFINRVLCYVLCIHRRLFMSSASSKARLQVCLQDGDLGRLEDAPVVAVLGRAKGVESRKAHAVSCKSASRTHGQTD